MAREVSAAFARVVGQPRLDALVAAGAYHEDVFSSGVKGEQRKVAARAAQRSAALRSMTYKIRSTVCGDLGAAALAAVSALAEDTAAAPAASANGSGSATLPLPAARQVAPSSAEDEPSGHAAEPMPSRSAASGPRLVVEIPAVADRSSADGAPVAAEAVVSPGATLLLSPSTRRLERVAGSLTPSVANSFASGSDKYESTFHYALRP